MVILGVLLFLVVSVQLGGPMGRDSVDERESGDEEELTVGVEVGVGVALVLGFSCWVYHLSRGNALIGKRRPTHGRAYRSSGDGVRTRQIA